MIAAVEEQVLRRFHVDVLPVDLSGIVVRRPPRPGLGSARGLRRHASAASRPAPRIREDADGSWVLLDADGADTSFRMPKGGYYFDDIAFNRGGRIDPAKFRPQTDIPDESLRLLSDYAAACTATPTTPCWAGASASASWA